MATTKAHDTLSSQLSELRNLFVLLETVPDSREHDELIERTRSAIAAVRRTRAALANSTVAAAS